MGARALTPGGRSELEAKVREYPNPRGATIGRRIFARQVPAAASQETGVRWHGLEELYR